MKLIRLRTRSNSRNSNAVSLLPLFPLCGSFLRLVLVIVASISSRFVFYHLPGLVGGGVHRSSKDTSKKKAEEAA